MRKPGIWHALLRELKATVKKLMQAVKSTVPVMAEARQDISQMLDEHDEEPHTVRERLRKHQQEQTEPLKKGKDRDHETHGQHQT